MWDGKKAKLSRRDCEAGGKDGMRGEVQGPHTMLC